MKSNYLILTAAVILFAACSRAPDDTTPHDEKADLNDAREDLTMADYEKLEIEAFHGDYQAQRNLSYWLSGGIGVPPQNPILGCAWRLVILKGGSPSLDESDTSNKQLYCDKRLTPDELSAAKAQAEKLAASIKGR